MTVTKKPDRRGEYDISRKTIAWGMPGVSRCDLTNACAFYHYPCTRGYRAHRTPGIPCALLGARYLQDPGTSRRGIAQSCLETPAGPAAACGPKRVPCRARRPR